MRRDAPPGSSANGYQVLRLWNTELLEDPHAAADYILSKLTNDP